MARRIDFQSVWQVKPFKDGVQPAQLLNMQLVPRSNIFPHGYENKSVNDALGNHRLLFWDKYKTH